ncbi:MAG: hypothetical protein E3J70_08665 [Candidatus Heimdallarchaeota archaeon]|nr:MAG: hypothetical protein E3J70_08665 [Candidatus Heimdallarchaeota archaeon]
MIEIQRIIRNKTAKSKKSIVGWLVAIGVGGIIAMFVFGSAGSAMGIILGAIIFIGIAVGVYFILRRIDDVPEALA